MQAQSVSSAPVTSVTASKRSMINFYSYLVAVIMAAVGIYIHLKSYTLVCDSLDDSKKNMRKIGYIMLGTALLSSIFMFAD